MDNPGKDTLKQLLTSCKVEGKCKKTKKNINSLLALANQIHVPEMRGWMYFCLLSNVLHIQLHVSQNYPCPVF